ncbi:hypothetical protein Nepgr_007700 [Nepenthes gracilis]|uniref:Uncharacterized protein n=1 Tax=Nepenthes gracilis TaxID=150966 RepID=A0AAD3S7D1_NEPGR|nr:hypothetical protein Nepgr_007700 [Nepenthes gracilis]
MATSKIIRGKRPAAAAASVPELAASKAPAAAPAPVIPEAAREELATGEDSDAFIERVLEEAAASFAPESATRPPESGPHPTSRPKGPTRKLHEGKRLAYAVAHEVEQRDLLIAEKEAEIAWLEAELANAKGDRREEVAALEVVVAVTRPVFQLEAENTGSEGIGWAARGKQQTTIGSCYIL